MSALSNIRVLDFGRYIAGPYCAMLLADMGADVIRVERPGGGEDRTLVPVTNDGEGALFLQANRNKRSLTLNPQAEGGGAIAARLVASADVVIVNAPTDALPAMGLDYAQLKAIRPDIILVNVSSFGSSGPWAQRPGFDSIGQAMCGAAYLSGPGGEPSRAPITWVDHASALYAAFGVMTALFERTSTGRGQFVEGSLLATALAVSSTFLIEQALTNADRKPIGNRSYFNGPTDTFRTMDGWIVTQVVSQHQFRRWTKLMDEPHWLSDPRFADDALRGENGAVLSERMAQWCAQRTNQQALDALASAHLPAGPVLSPRDALEHPQVKALDLVANVDVAGVEGGAPLVRTPLTFNETSAPIRRPPPRAGEHTDEILQDLGFSAAEIETFRAKAVI